MKKVYLNKYEGIDCKSVIMGLLNLQPVDKMKLGEIGWASKLVRDINSSVATVLTVEDQAYDVLMHYLVLQQFRTNGPILKKVIEKLKNINKDE